MALKKSNTNLRLEHSVRKNRTAFLDVPSLLEIFHWNDPKSRVPFTFKPNFPESSCKWLTIPGQQSTSHLAQNSSKNFDRSRCYRLHQYVVEIVVQYAGHWWRPRKPLHLHLQNSVLIFFMHPCLTIQVDEFIIIWWMSLPFLGQFLLYFSFCCVFTSLRSRRQKR